MDHSAARAYNKRYGAMLIEHMASGLSFESFAAELEVSKDTLESWLSDNIDFKESFDIGSAKLLKYWELLGIRNVANKKFNVNLWALNMKNRFKWSDRQDFNHDIGDNTKEAMLSINDAKKILNADPILLK